MPTVASVARRGLRSIFRDGTAYIFAGGFLLALFLGFSSRLTSAIASMIAEQRPTVAFLTGFGARSPDDVQGLAELLQGRYEIHTMDMAVDPALQLSPDRFAVVVMLGPQAQVGPRAAAAVEAYLEAGGAALLALEGNRVDIEKEHLEPATSGLEAVLERRGLRLVPGVAYDLRWNQFISIGTRARDSRVFPYPFFPNADLGTEHPITKNLQAFSLGWPTSLDIIDSVRVIPLWTSTEVGGRFTGARTVNPEVQLDRVRDVVGRQVYAAVVLPQRGGQGASSAGRGRLVVVGDANFLDDRFARFNRDNLAFVSNAIDWLARANR